VAVIPSSGERYFTRLVKQIVSRNTPLP